MKASRKRERDKKPSASLSLSSSAPSALSQVSSSGSSSSSSSSSSFVHVQTPAGDLSSSAAAAFHVGHILLSDIKPDNTGMKDNDKDVDTDQGQGKHTSRAEMENMLGLRRKTHDSSSYGNGTVNNETAFLVSQTHPALCARQVDALYRHYYAKEEMYQAPLYMHKQTDININYRVILIDWLALVHDRYDFAPAVRWLSVNILDRYLASADVPKKELQLVGITAFVIATKFEDSHTLDVDECCTLSDHVFQAQDVRKMELSILVALDFKVHVPTTYHFLQRYIEVFSGPTIYDATEGLTSEEIYSFPAVGTGGVNVSAKHIGMRSLFPTLASFYAEKYLQEYDSLYHPPHVTAAAAVYAALVQGAQHNNTTYPKRVWPQILVEETGLHESDIIDVARIIIMFVREDTESPNEKLLDSVRKKYSTAKYLYVASMPLPSI